MMAKGDGGVEIERFGLAAQRLDQLVMHDLDDHLAGRDGLHQLMADGLGAHPVGEGAHHVERHIRLDQRAAHFAHRGRHVGFPTARRVR